MTHVSGANPSAPTIEPRAATGDRPHGVQDRPTTPPPPPPIPSPAPAKRSALASRLTLGPLLLVALGGVLWLDQYLDAAGVPGVLRPLLGGRETFPPGVVLFTVALLVCPLAARELARIFRLIGVRTSTLVLSVSALLGLAASCLVPESVAAPMGAELVATAGVVATAVAMVAHLRLRDPRGAAGAGGAALFAFVYLGLFFGFFLALRREFPAWAILWVLVTTKSSDIGAFFVGRAVGRHKLIPWLSPGKTWEGLAGGVVLAAAVGAGGAWVLGPSASGELTSLSWAEGAAAGVLFALTGQGGDLLASALKRDAGMKDSGSSMAGFGGILDVTDSLLLVAPVAYWFLTLRA